METETQFTTDKIIDAIKQVISLCDDLQADYEPVSMRGALYTLGYDEDQADAVINYCAANGFNYCIDPSISATHFDPNNRNAVNDMVTDRPSADACYWGPDQLKSRLAFVR